MLLIITWYLALQLFAFAAWPLAFSICHRLHDRGYGLSKGLGLLLVTFITWLLAHLANRLPTFGSSFATVSAAWVGVVLISLVCIVRNSSDMARFLRREFRFVLTLEVVLLVAFALMVGLRAAVPHISYYIPNPMPGSVVDHAAEKFTDFGVLNSLLTSSAFPPHDAWVSGLTLNYYYFGHMLWATLIKFSSIRPEIGFNLALASAFALAAALSFALGYNLTRRIRWGFMTLFLVVLCSNLDGFFQFLAAIKTALFDSGGPNAWFYGDRPWWQNYDFWRSSRAIENTINEFPAFSFILGDLHAHMSALIINLCGWHVAVQMFRSVRRYNSLWRYEVNAWDELFLAALICGALSATNSWDVPLFAGVIALALWSGGTGRRDPFAYMSRGAEMAGRACRAIEALIVSGIVTIFGVALLFFPFLYNFYAPDPPLEAQEKVIDGVTKVVWEPGNLIKLVDAANRSSPFEFVAHWFLLALIPAALLLTIWRRRKKSTNGITPPLTGRAKQTALVLVAAAVAVVLVPLWQGWVGIAMAALAVFIAVTLVAQSLPPMARWTVGLLLVFCVMTWFCELFYIDDVYVGVIERINTVFKVYYGLWPMMAVATVISLRILIRLAHGSRGRRWRAVWLVAPLVIAGSPYMVLGTMHRIESSTRLGHWTPPKDSPPTEPPAALLRPEARAKNLTEALDGLRYLSFVHPSDYAALMWVRANLPNDAVLLEAAGMQYTYAGRFGTITGRPSFAGLIGHAANWRGSAFGDPNNLNNEQLRRTEIVSAIYNEEIPVVALAMLQKENIEYAIVGNQEHELYPALNEEKFKTIGKKVFSHGSTSVYKIGPHQ